MDSSITNLRITMQSETVVDPLVKKRFWYFLLLTVIAYFLMRFITHNLSGKEIINFEIAKTVDNATAMMGVWGAEGIARFLNGIYGDFLFILGYAGTLFFGCRYIGSLSGNYILRKAGNIFSFLALVAGLCDVVENIGMIYTLRQGASGWVVHLTSDMARIKFSLIFILLLYIIICLLFRGIDLLASGSRKKTIL